MMKHLDMVTCQALRRLGFPQESFHFRWYWHLDHPRWPIKPGPMVICEKVFSAPGFGWGGPWQVDYVACPSPLEALEWLEREKGITFERHYDPRTQYTAEWQAIWYEDSMSLIGIGGGMLPSDHLIAATAQELVRAICTRLELDAVVEQVKQKEED